MRSDIDQSQLVRGAVVIDAHRWLAATAGRRHYIVSDDWWLTDSDESEWLMWFNVTMTDSDTWYT